MRYAIITDGIVSNVTEWDGESEWAPPEGSTLVQSDEAGPGDSYDGRAFTHPEPPEPELAEARPARAGAAMDMESSEPPFTADEIKRLRALLGE